MMDEHDQEKPNVLNLRSNRPAALEQLNGAWLHVTDPDLTRNIMDEEADAQGVARFEGHVLPTGFPKFFWKAWSCAICCAESTSSYDWASRSLSCS